MSRFTPPGGRTPEEPLGGAIYCPVCSTANRAGSVFCNQCGQTLGKSLQVSCPACGAGVLPGSRFCQRCGVVLDAAVTPGEGTPAGGAVDLSAASDDDDGPLEDDAPIFAEQGFTLPETDLVLAEHALERPAAAPGAPPGVDDLLAQLDSSLPQPSFEPAPGRTAGDLPGRDLGTPLPASGAAGATLAAVLASPPARHAETASRSAGAPPASPIVTRILYLALFAAVLFPLMFPGEWSGSTVPLSPSTAAFFERVAAVRAGAPVLVAFDYDPATQAELDPQARAVIAHLMRLRARIVAVSLLPQGPAMAESVLSAVASGQGYRYGEDYINLGYLSGEEAAMAALSADITAAFPQDWREQRPTAGRPAISGVTGIRAFDSVIVFSGDEGNAVRWLTQVGGRHGISLLAGVSAVSVARLQTFEQSGQLAGILAGLPGAAEYELLLNEPGRAVRMLDAQSLAHGVIVVFVLAGNLALVGGGLARRRFAAGE